MLSGEAWWTNGKTVSSNYNRQAINATEGAPAPLGAYSHAVRAGSLLFQFQYFSLDHPPARTTIQAAAWPGKSFMEPRAALNFHYFADFAADDDIDFPGWSITADTEGKLQEVWN